MNLQWPAKKSNNWIPWYLILYRFIFCVPFIYGGLALTCLGILLARGPKIAKRAFVNFHLF